MEAIRIVLLCVAAALIAVVIKKQQPGMGALVAMAAGFVAFGLSIPSIRLVTDTFTFLSARAGLASGSTSIMLRACGISLICEFGAGLCRDADEAVLAQRIDFSGRMALLAMSVPLLTQLMEGMLEWLP